jgi:hypothetical protein
MHCLIQGNITIYRPQLQLLFVLLQRGYMQHQRGSAVALWAAGQGQDTPTAPSTRQAST